MTPGFAPKTVKQKLSHLTEECAEVILEIAKAQRFGLDSKNPLLPPEQQETNRAAILREIADLENACAKVKQAISKGRAS